MRPSTGRYLSPTQQRRAQLVQAGERQLHLRFDPRGPGHPHVRRRPGCVLEQRRLAHPGLTAHHQRPAASRPQIPEEAIERRALCLAVQQVGHRLRSRPHAPLPPGIQHQPPARLTRQASGAPLCQHPSTPPGQPRRCGDGHLQPTDRPTRLSRGMIRPAFLDPPGRICSIASSSLGDPTSQASSCVDGVGAPTYRNTKTRWRVAWWIMNAGRPIGG